MLAAGLVVPVVWPRSKRKRASAKREEADRIGRAEEIFRRVQQKASTLRQAYARVLESKDAGSVRRETELPASKEAVKAAILLYAYLFKLEGHLRDDEFKAHQTCYGRLADFVGDEVLATRSRWPTQSFEASRGQVEPEPTWVPEKVEDVVRLQFALSHEFSSLCDEFKQHMDALSDPALGRAELLRIGDILHRCRTA